MVFLDPLMVLVVCLCATVHAAADADPQPVTYPRRWRWPESFDPVPEPEPALPKGRYIVSRPIFGYLDNNNFNSKPKSPPVIISSTARPPPPVRTTPAPRPTTTSTTTVAPSTASGADDDTELVPNTTGTSLLKDAGKPGNPYALLNVMFPPENSLRTPEQEAQVQASLHNKDLGGLHPEEVYLADDDLFVVKGYNMPMSYDQQKVQPSDVIDNTDSPKPRPPPQPEPGTAFFHFPDYIKRQFPYLPFPDPRDDPRVQQTALLGGPNDPLPFNFTEDGRPIPFIPPPPPHWDSTLNLDLNPQLRPQLPSPPPPPPGNFPSPPNSPDSNVPPQGFSQEFPPSNDTIPPGNGADDAEVDFMPLFPERPIEYYYPSNTATEVPPGPSGPGIYVPPPKGFFATFNRPPMPLRQPLNRPGRPPTIHAFQNNVAKPTTTQTPVFPGHSLGSDIFVNFKHPLPEEEPDAEIITVTTPATPSATPPQPLSWYNVNININGHAAPHQFPGLSVYLPPYVRYDFEATTPRSSITPSASVKVYQQGLGVDYSYQISG